jgi:hypothetical protein
MKFFNREKGRNARKEDLGCGLGLMPAALDRIYRILQNFSVDTSLGTTEYTEHTEVLDLPIHF